MKPIPGEESFDSPPKLFDQKSTDQVISHFDSFLECTQKFIDVIIVDSYTFQVQSHRKRITGMWDAGVDGIHPCLVNLNDFKWPSLALHLDSIAEETNQSFDDLSVP